MAGVEAALKRYPSIDQDKLGVTGGGYGGFLTNWIVSHPDRSKFKFKAAVTLRSDFISDEGTRDGAYEHADEFGDNLFDEFDYYWNVSPMNCAGNVKNADADLALRQRFPRADRAGRTVVPRPETFRR